MAWVAVDKDEAEVIFRGEPERFRDKVWSDCVEDGEILEYDTRLDLPKGSIRKLIGKDLTWQDEPVELTEN